jgi:tetratricopeptide (TPR) repeat protein
MPLEGTGKPSEDTECRYIIRQPTVNGDSGSAIVNEKGLADGIVIDGQESQGTPSMAEMVVRPLSCALNSILQFVPNDDSSTILKKLASSDQEALKIAFQPPPSSASGWITNLRLAKALSVWIAQHKENPQIPPAVPPQRMPDVDAIIVERGLGYRLLNEFLVADLGTQSAAADSLQKFADSLREAGANQKAARALDEATRLYLADATSRLPHSWTPAEGPLTGDPTIAKLYKAAADALTKLAEVTGRSNLYDPAAQLAAAAVFHAAPGALKASSWAALGTALQGQGNTRAAVPALKEAKKEGSTAPWVGTSLHFLEKQLGNSPTLNIGSDYLQEQARIVGKGQAGLVARVPDEPQTFLKGG